MLWALNACEFLEKSAHVNVPGAMIGERFHHVAYLPPCLLLDEWSCLQRIEGKIEVIGMGEG